ncbi:triosephosphate isomerase [Advenella kashmirensis W13003]|uniref:Triosephosphate isomerase n=1 Tax=Advenella kashmirensis W13003 TaxID=1424334 RepID=V8QNS7_9BURK|nr:triose-phosphate isomerase [Advenella kashmirensis]ETF01611.1 triosephosphate isomerase [Advenella kashmirensis W13003]
MSMRRRLVIGNWKMNGNRAENQQLLSDLVNLQKVGGAGADDGTKGADVELAVCAPFPYLPQVADALKGTGITWGAQDASEHAKGAYTGEVSVAMLAEFGCSWALVGHSERRAYHGETSDVVARKAAAVIQGGLTPVVCVGETQAEREAGDTLKIIDEQLAPVLALGADAVKNMVLAYEPVWAIGTGLTASPEQAQEVHAHIRKLLAAAGAPEQRVLYGGSVKAANATSLFAKEDIDGALVGGASLVATDFQGIADA